MSLIPRPLDYQAYGGIAGVGRAAKYWAWRNKRRGRRYLAENEDYAPEPKPSLRRHHWDGFQQQLKEQCGIELRERADGVVFRGRVMPCAE